MRVYLSFDVEIWCNGWSDLDQVFPAAFERYVYGRSEQGAYALPKTLDILNKYGLRGVFFVEPLFAARFGQKYLAEIVGLIEAADQDVQLHLHPEWTDEIRPALIEDVSLKRQHLIHYNLAEQVALIGAGKRMIEACTGRAVRAFRAGSYAANAQTFEALVQLEIYADSSLNEVSPVSGQGLAMPMGPWPAQTLCGVSSYPVTVFRDGFGQLRPAQLGACSFAELSHALRDAERNGEPHFVIVSHNFEMLKPGRCARDAVVARRFEQLCEFLSQNRQRFEVGSYSFTAPLFESAQKPAVTAPRPQATVAATARRHMEQALRRLI